MKKILIPVDFSTCSDNACDYAYGLAKATGAAIRFVHAMYDPIVQSDLPAYGYGTALGTTENVIYKVEIEARKSLKYLKERFQIKAELEHTNMDISTVLRDGFPENEIAAEYAAWEPDLIVMGTHGRGSMLQMLLGSVCARVIERVSAPVLAIPGNVQYEGISHIMYASAFEHNDGENVENILDIFSAVDPEISCVNVVWDVQYGIRPWQRQKLREELEALIRVDCRSPKIRFDIIEGKHLQNRLKRYVHTHRVDMLVMSVHRRNLFGKWFHPSKTRSMMGTTDVPLLAMHV